MRLAVNLSYLRPAVGGSSIYTLEILRRLAQRDDVELVVFGNRVDLSELGEFSVATLSVPGHGLAGRGGHQAARLWVEAIGARFVPELRGVDAIWSPGNTAVVLGRSSGRTPPQLVTVHDAIHATEHNPLGGLQTRRRHLAMMSALHRSHRVLVPSEFVADHLRQVYPFAADIIVATGEGVDVDRRRPARIDVPDDYLICPSTDHRHKHHDELFRSLADAGFNDGSTALVLTGYRYQGEHHLIDLAMTQGLRRDRVIDLGHVDEHGAVLDLMARSRAVVLPSRFEGWGLPALESLALGRPTIANAVGGVPEFAGPGLCVPDDVDGWAHQLRSILDDPSALTAAAEADAERIRSTFTWERVADRLVDAALSQ